MATSAAPSAAAERASAPLPPRGSGEAVVAVGLPVVVLAALRWAPPAWLVAAGLSVLLVAVTAGGADGAPLRILSSQE